MHRPTCCNHRDPGAHRNTATLGGAPAQDMDMLAPSMGGCVPGQSSHPELRN
jgi:hypothetical protein